MMRSLFSGVAGLKVHQTRMDVIGNNIANVNTTAYKSQSMVFSDLLYQTTQAASGANAATGRGGINARQIGLGAKTGAISTAIATQGSAQSTNNPWDIMITGDSFFVVSNGSQNFFTRDGSFTVDGAGNLVMSSTGYTVMGWQVDEETGEIYPDTVSALKVMKEENMTYPPESTTLAYMSGIVDKYDSALSSTGGRVTTLTFFDQQGYQYTAKFSIHSLGSAGQYYVQLDDILNENGDSIVEEYGLSSINEIATFGAQDTIETTTLYNLLDTATYTEGANGAQGTWSMKYVPGNILEGYASNQLVNAASTIKIDLADKAEVGPGSANEKVKVTGTVELSKNELQAENFNLIYAPIKVTDGNGNETTEYHYYGKVEAADGTVTTVKLPDTVAAGGDTSQWKAVLEKSFPGVSVTSIKVNSDGSVEMGFEQEFTATEKGTYNLAENYFVGDEIDDPLAAYGLKNTDDTEYSIQAIAPNGAAQITKKFTYTGNRLVYETEKGLFDYIGSQGNDSATLNFNASATSRQGEVIDLSRFTNIDIDFSLSKNYNNGGSSTASMQSGDKGGNNLGTGRKQGEMTGIEIAQDGKITAYYDNSCSRLLGQIAVANFANASGLSKQGDNLYSATANSGEFDGIGDDITANDGYMTSGVLEMSNVDLSQEFTEMITTQRGFQANSRIITTSDTLLEELVNLKR
ncbi:MAG: flagellar hook-basal body complex protein [Lachnospiraceae bacterium]|nr:flagellar hook-basal body complex protein [Lachnospiraceae bacterium]